MRLRQRDLTANHLHTQILLFCWVSLASTLLDSPFLSLPPWSLTHHTPSSHQRKLGKSPSSSCSCCYLVAKLYLSLLWPLWTVARRAPLSLGLSRQEYWSGLPFPSSGDLPDPGIKLECPALASGFFTPEPPGKPFLWQSSLITTFSYIFPPLEFHLSP